VISLVISYSSGFNSQHSSSYESTVDDFDDEAKETCSDVTPGTSGSPSSVDVDNSSTNVSH